MGLRNIKIPERSIPYGDGEITVRGVSMNDLMVLVDVYGPQTAMVFGKVQKGGMLDKRDTTQIIGALAKEVPEMATALVALAADEYNPDGMAIIAKLPFNIQIECLEAIFRLTFTSESDVKKLIGSLTQMALEVSGALTEMSSSLPTGIGASAAA